VVKLLRLNDGLREPVAGSLKLRLVEFEPTEREQDVDAALLISGAIGRGETEFEQRPCLTRRGGLQCRGSEGAERASLQLGAIAGLRDQAPAELARRGVFAGLHEALKEQCVCRYTPAFGLLEIGGIDGLDGGQCLLGKRTDPRKASGARLMTGREEELADSSFVLPGGE
jgi:hypothetical protein